MKNFTVTAAANKKEINVTTDAHNRFRAFGEIAEFLNRDGKFVLFFDTTRSKKVKSEVEKMFGRKLPAGNLNITLTEESKSLVEKIKIDYSAAYEAAKNAAEPIAFEMHDTNDYGDYSSSHDRYIRVYRAPLAEFGESGNKFINILDFSDKKIGKFEKEWDTQFAALKGESKNDSFNISAEQAQFWMNADAELKAEEAAKEAAKEAVKNEAVKVAKAKNEAATELAFTQARETGKPVELFSEFLIGNEIPRKFRDEDSDMGNLVTYAMPDGTTSESFYHSY